MIIPDSILVPREAYQYEPDPHIVFHGKGKKAQRFVFMNQKFSDFENDKLSRLEAELQKMKLNPYQTHPNWVRSDLLRFCYGTGWKTRVAVKVLVNYLKWYDSIMPNGYRSLYPKVLKMLDSGCLYVHGRDTHYRPIIIIDIPKFDFKKHSVIEYIQFIAFFLEYIKDNMLLPGRVENWVLITDMGHQGLGPSSLSKLKEVMKVLTDNYRCRLGVNYILNPPKTVYFIWSCIKPFMDEVLIEKMKIINNSFSAELLTHCNPWQIEVKYGGKAPNLHTHWPPYVPDIPFHLESSLSFIDKSSKNIVININPVEPSEISLADTKLTQSMRMFGDIASEKQAESFFDKEVSEKSLIVIEENINETNEMLSIPRETEKINKKKEKKQRRIERKLRRKQRELESCQIIEEEKEIQAIIVQVDDIQVEELEKLEAEIDQMEPYEIQNEILVETTKKEVGCSMCSAIHSRCLVF